MQEEKEFSINKTYETWCEDEVVAILATHKWIRKKYPQEKNLKRFYWLLYQKSASYLKEKHRSISKIRFKLTHIRRNQHLFDWDNLNSQIDDFISENLSE